MMGKLFGNLARLVSIALVIALLGACTDTGLFLPDQDEVHRIEILTVESGTVLSPEDVVTIELVFEGETLEIDLMEISLSDSHGTKLFSQILGPDEIQELPTPVELPDLLETGQYRFRVALYLQEELVAERESEIYLAAQPHTILGVVPYPGIFYPGGKALLLSGIDVPEYSDPFLRWRTPSGVVAEGRLSDGFDLIQIDVPEREGVFSLTLELFPVAADHEQPPIYDLLSTNRLEMRFFVSYNQSDETHELGPVENYSALYHFRGEAIDRGTDRINEPSSSPGLLSFGIADESFGLQLGNGLSLAAERSLIPLEDSSIRPFTASVRGVFAGYGSIFSVRDAEGGLFAQLGIDHAGAPRIVIGEIVSRVDSVVVPIGTTVELSVSVIPEPEALRFLWFLSGYQIGEDAVSVTEAIGLPEAPYTIIGGESGAPMVVDEFGIYSVETEEVDSAIFTRAMRLEYGSDLLFAEGFDGVTLPEEITVEGDSEGVVVENGAAFLSPGSSILLPPIPIDFETFSLEVYPGQGEVSIDAYLEVRSSPSLDRLVRYETGAGYRSSSDMVLPLSEPEEFIRVDLAITDEGATLLYRAKTLDLGELPYTDASLIVSIGTMGEASVSIDSILITRNRIESVE